MNRRLLLICILFLFNVLGCLGSDDNDNNNNSNESAQSSAENVEDAEDAEDKETISKTRKASLTRKAPLPSAQREKVIPPACPHGEHFRVGSDSFQCDPNEIDCSPAVTHGFGKRIWNELAQAYGACFITNCDRGYRQQGSQCVPVASDLPTRNQGQGQGQGQSQTPTCNDIAHGTAKEDTNNSANCVITGCHAGYYKNNNACVPVDSGYVSAEGDLTQTKCEKDQTPDAFKSLCMNWKDCPTGFLKIQPLSNYTSLPFCVAKYEMKDNGSGFAVSKAKNVPYVNLTKAQAIQKCTNIGTGFDLITNDQWQTLARNIEQVTSNWANASIGDGDLNQGHSDGIPNRALEASKNDNRGCYETGQACLSSKNVKVWHAQRRTHFFSSSKEPIWDLAGNVREWVKDENAINYGDAQYISLVTGSSHPTLGALSGGTTTISRTAKDQFGPSENFDNVFTSGNYGGLGRLIIVRQGSILRGGVWNEKNHTGLFSVLQGARSSHKGSDIGFRCAYDPYANIPSRCMKPAESGRCRAVFTRYYFDFTEGVCKTFNYGGCGFIPQTDHNRFDSEANCESVCLGPRRGVASSSSTSTSTSTSTSSSTSSQQPSQQPAQPQSPQTDTSSRPSRCTKPAESGRCRAVFTKYYFNSTKNKCETFNYGGCGFIPQTDHNRFDSKANCESVCAGSSSSSPSSD